MGDGELLARLVVGTLFGAIIGYERQFQVSLPVPFLHNATDDAMVAIERSPEYCASTWTFWSRAGPARYPRPKRPVATAWGIARSRRRWRGRRRWPAPRAAAPGQIAG